MKRFLTIILVALFVFAFSGCDNTKSSKSPAKVSLNEAKQETRLAVVNLMNEKFGHLRPEINLSSGSIIFTSESDNDDENYNFKGYTTIYYAYDYSTNSQKLFAKIYFNANVSKSSGEVTITKFE